jgi:hypothetical protein
MTHLNHVTFHVPLGSLTGANGENVTDFMDMLGLYEVEPEEAPEGLRVRWFAVRDPMWSESYPRPPLVHLVEGYQFARTHGFYDQPALGHICIATGQLHMNAIRILAKERSWVERDGGSGTDRFWLRLGPSIRVEVRHDGSVDDR